MKTSQEKIFKPVSGYAMFPLIMIVFLGSLFLAIATKNPFMLIPLLLSGLLFAGFFFVNPNESRVLVLFGEYIGTVKANGFHWANPLYFKTNISLRARNFDSEKVKVNDKLGNPIMISIILVWQVEDTFKAAFEVDNYENFVRVQSDSAVRKLAGTYPYDNFEDDHSEITLRSGVNEVNEMLEKELEERLSIAGIRVIEARIGYLAYASEIASAMLKRQQATAVVAARHKIVEGAVGMVEMAIEQLSTKKLMDLDEERKAVMVSNLMVVLCSDKDVTPVINSGTLH